MLLNAKKVVMVLFLLFGGRVARSTVRYLLFGDSRSTVLYLLFGDRAGVLYCSCMFGGRVGVLYSL